MAECSLCSLFGFIWSCVTNLFLSALDYPIFVFIISIIIGFLIASNFCSAKNMCNFGCRGQSRVAPACAPNRRFGYGPNNGPHTWPCPHTNQSPINITEEVVRRRIMRELLIWSHYGDLPTGVMLENNGNTVVLRACYDGNVPTINGAHLLSSYKFVELCFRWSSLSNEGSEHMLHHRRFPLEMQVMHRTGPPGCRTSSHDLLMIAYLFEISSTNQFLDPFTQNLRRIRNPGAKIEIPPFPLSYLVQPFRSGFYSYTGSLTEPPCYEGAEWFIFPEPLAISERQLYDFRQLLSSDGRNRITSNARPVQSLGCTRIVHWNQYSTLSQAANPPCDLSAQGEANC